MTSSSGFFGPPTSQQRAQAYASEVEKKLRNKAVTDLALTEALMAIFYQLRAANENTEAVEAMRELTHELRRNNDAR